MPSHVFAAPPRQVSGSPASPAQYDKEKFALPVLQEVKVVYETEYVLDFQGRKHLDREASDEKYHFGPQEDASATSYPDFTMPGLTSANTLRDFLRQHLQPHQVVDEYGDEGDLCDISNDHLPVLQAKVWTKSSTNHSPTKASAQRPSRAQFLIAGHVAKISQLLEEKHIFVFSDDTKNDICDYLSDLRDTPKHTCHAKIVRIEPLIHWGTVTPAGPWHYILPFHRNGELVQDREKPEFKLLVRRIVGTNAPAYCVDCLGYLWNKRAEARETMRQLQGAVPRPDSSVSEYTAPLRPVLKLKGSESVLKDAGTLAIGGTVGTTANRVKQAAGELQEHFGEALPQLDGASDHLDEVQIGGSSGNKQGNNAIWISSDSDEPVDKRTVCARPLRRKDSFTLPLRPTSIMPKSSSGNSTPFAPPSRPSVSSATRASTAKENTHTKSITTKDNCDTQIIDLTTPPRIKERKFGRELDTNAKAPLIQVSRSPRKHKTDMFMAQEIRPAPVKSMKALKPVQKTKTVPKETKKRKTVAVGQQIGKQKKARIIAPKESIPIDRMEIAPKDSTPTQSQPRTISMVGLQYAPKPEPTAQSSLPPELIVHFAKRPRELQVPDGVATPIYEDFQTTHPAPTSKICWCNKPASHGTFKKKEDPQIAQCTNKDCRFRWFHYACLNLSEKAKARFGTLLCSVCRMEQDFAEQDRKNGWSGEKLMDVQPIWTKEDIETQIPGLGGVVPPASPYGLGIEVQLGPMYDAQVKETGTLGGLEKLEYPQSRPEMLEEAYLHAGAYAEVLARRAEEEWDDVTYAGEEEYDDDGLDDEEMDEEL